MKIGVDMDSVLAEIVPELLRFHNVNYKTNHLPKDHTDYNLTKLWNCDPDELLKRIHHFYRSTFFHNTLPIDGSQKGIDMLSRQHELVLITSRAWYIEEHSKKWLQKHFPGKFSHIVHTNQVSGPQEKKVKKSQICKEHKIQIMIEDALVYAYDCASIGIKVILLNQNWNQDDNLPNNVKRAFSWKEIVKLI